MLFPKADIDSLIQIQDMFRIDATNSFYTDNETLSAVNIYPDFDNQPLVFFDVLPEGSKDCWFLDWAYSVAGDYTVKVEILSDITASVDADYTVTVLSEEEDNLLSNDAMIYQYESDLRKYLPRSRNSWKYIHRLAQTEILDYMYRNLILNPDKSRILKSQLIGDKLSEWSVFEALILIYQDIKSSNSELFNTKITDYTQKRNEARKRYLIEYDSNKDGIITDEDRPIATTTRFFTR